MIANQNSVSSLPMSAMKEIPSPKEDAKQIVGLTKEKGKITGYKLSDGSLVSKAEGVTLARQGEISGVGISTNRGNEYLKSLPDNAEDNNLGNLPTIRN